MRKFILVSGIVVLAVYLWYRMLAKAWPGRDNDSTDEIYREILVSDRYKVKGRFEE